MNAAELLDSIKSDRGFKTDAEVAKYLGLTAPRIAQMRGKNAMLTIRQITRHLENATAAAAENALVNSIRPIVEMYPVDRTAWKHDAKWEVLPTRTDVRNRPIREHLEKVAGRYVFFDSARRAV